MANRSDGLRGQKLLQVWQWSTSGISSLPDAITIAKGSDFTGLNIKAMDGLDWMASFDTGVAVGSIADVIDDVEYIRRAGLFAAYWVVPKSNVDLRQQATAYAEIANACDALFLDVEDGRGFWGSPGPHVVADFITPLRALCPDALLVLQPDPRQSHLDAIDYAMWMQQCDMISGQHYFKEFNTLPESEATRVIGHFPTVNGADGSEEIGVFFENILGGVEGFCAWRLGIIPSETLYFLGQYTLGSGGTVTDKPDGVQNWIDVVGGWSGLTSQPDDLLAAVKTMREHAIKLHALAIVLTSQAGALETAASDLEQKADRVEEAAKELRDVAGGIKAAFP